MQSKHINDLMAQMRVTAGRLDALRAPLEGAEAASGPGFKQQLADAIEMVSDTQKAGAEGAAAVERNDPDADLAQVMVQLQKADLSFRAMTEVRNKLVTAYQEIMNMPV